MTKTLGQLAVKCGMIVTAIAAGGAANAEPTTPTPGPVTGTITQTVNGNKIEAQFDMSTDMLGPVPGYIG